MDHSTKKNPPTTKTPTPPPQKFFKNNLRETRKKQKTSAPEKPHQVVEFRVLTEKRFALLLLITHKVLDVHVKAR